jgi:hypothetical protein
MVSQGTSDEVFTRIMQDPSNSICMDCSSQVVKFASVNHGIFLCENCSKIHQLLGRSLSFVKSLKDSWSIRQLKLLTVGGNETLRKFFHSYNMPEEASVQFKYCTLAAKYYREMLKVMAEGETCSMPTPSQEEGLTLTVDISIFKQEEKKQEEEKPPVSNFFSSAISKTYGLGKNLVGKVLENEKIREIEQKAIETAQKVSSGILHRAREGIEQLGTRSEIQTKGVNLLKDGALHAYDSMTGAAYSTYQTLSNDERTRRIREDSMSFLLNLESSLKSKSQESD